MQTMEQWLNTTPILLIGLVLAMAMIGAGAIGHLIQKRIKQRGPAEADDKQGYVVSAVLGLLALLLGFTFALAVDRFETRRALVLQEANAIGTSYLRAQLLDEPHRTRMSGVLLAYTENRIALGTALPAALPPLLQKNDQLLTDLWSATAAAFDSVRNLDFSQSLLEPVNEVIDLDASRKAARNAHVPSEVFLVLFLYVTVTSGILGHVLGYSRHKGIVCILFALQLISLLLILDIDRPTIGGVTEKQIPMIDLRDTLRKQPPGTFDQWRGQKAPD